MLQHFEQSQRGDLDCLRGVHDWCICSTAHPAPALGLLQHPRKLVVHLVLLLFDSPQPFEKASSPALGRCCKNTPTGGLFPKGYPEVLTAPVHVSGYPSKDKGLVFVCRRRACCHGASLYTIKLTCHPALGSLLAFRGLILEPRASSERACSY
jgi:hypothetical protein